MPAKTKCNPPKAPVNLVMVAGMGDTAVKYAGGTSPFRASGSNLSADKTIDLWLQRNNCDTPGEETPLPDSDPGDASRVFRSRYVCPQSSTELVFYRVEGGGHVVPSVRERVGRAWESFAGQQNHDIETAAEHWQFFASIPRP